MYVRLRPALTEPPAHSRCAPSRSVPREGEVSPAHDEARAAAYMKNQEIVIHVDLGLGGGTARVWTCDLTHGYIEINADYRS